jgi:hypothetical protein
MENKTIEEVLKELIERIEQLEKEVESLKSRMPFDSGRNHA